MKNIDFLSERELLSGIYTEVKEIKNKFPDHKEVIIDIGFIDNSELCRAMNISKKTQPHGEEKKCCALQRWEASFITSFLTSKPCCRKSLT